MFGMKQVEQNLKEFNSLNLRNRRDVINDLCWLGTVVLCHLQPQTPLSPLKLVSFLKAIHIKYHSKNVNFWTTSRNGYLLVKGSSSVIFFCRFCSA